MGEKSERSESQGGTGLIVGLMAGTIFGIGLGLLLAPKAGSELRDELGVRAKEVGGRLGERYKHAGETASQFVERGKEFAERGRNAVERGREVVSRGIEEVRRHGKAGQKEEPTVS